MAKISPTLKVLRKILGDDYKEYERQNSHYRQFWSDNKQTIPTIHVEGAIEPVGIKIIGTIRFTYVNDLTPPDPEGLHLTSKYRSQSREWGVSYLHRIPLDVEDLEASLVEHNLLVGSYMDTIARARGIPFMNREIHAYFVELKLEDNNA